MPISYQFLIDAHMMKQISMYLDTSIIGGYFDAEFEQPTKKLVKHVKIGLYRAYISDITLYELNKAHDELSDKFLTLLAEFDFKFIKKSFEIQDLAKEYISSKVLPQKCLDDARHVALASVKHVNYIIS